MRGAGVQIDQISERLLLLAGARAEEVKLGDQLVQRRILHHGLGLTDDAQAGARSVEVDGGGREEPVLQLLHELALLLGLLDFCKAGVIGEGLHFLGQRASGTEEEDGELLEAGAALGDDHARPPFVRAKVLPREIQLLEIILEQQP